MYEARTPGGHLHALHRIAEHLEEPAFLLPTQDRLVLEVSRTRDSLSGSLRFKLPAHDVVQVFMEKTRFYAWAAPLGLPLPESCVVQSEAELKAALNDMPYPLIVKPLVRTVAWDRANPVRKAILLHSAGDEAPSGADLFSLAPSYIISQWIPGPDHQVHYCLAYCAAPGQMTASYTGRKLLQYPRGTGSTAICAGTSNGEVRELAEEVFRQGEFLGLGSVEVKYGLNGRPYITEPTVGRPNLQSYSAVVAGCNLHALAMADALEMDFETCASDTRKSWWVQEGALRELSVARSGESVPWALLAKELITSRALGAAYLSWWDPIPLAALVWETVRRAFLFLTKRGR